MTTAELLTVTPEPGLAAAAPDLIRVLEAEGLPLRGARSVVAEDDVVEGALRQAVAGGGLVVCVSDGNGAGSARRALARLLGSRLVLSERVLEAVTASYAARGRAMPRRAEALALVPQGATPLVAAGGGEPGLLAESAGVLVTLLPAATAAAIALLREQVLPRLARPGAEPAAVIRTLRLVGATVTEAEPALAGALRGVDDVVGHAVDVSGEVWVRLRLEGPTPGAAAARLQSLEPAFQAAFGGAWYGVDGETLEEVVGRLLRARGLTLALAESCTGGLVGHRLTEVAGSSTYFERGLVVYSNAAKQALLGVSEALLARHGAVSAECAEAMAAGVRSRAGTDLGVSITGIAGPDGGSAAKPVGTVFVGLADARAVVSHRYRFDRDRAGNKLLSALAALDRIRRYCLASG